MLGTMAAASRVAEDINFAETSGQRRPDEDMLREEEVSIELISLCQVTHLLRVGSFNFPGIDTR